ncbi:MAG: YkgJ family cysteine cluster protein [Lentisphaeria bacterium]|nr:YkgJ family cysteine cluster protein [Lentisphaeria bacterium]
MFTCRRCGNCCRWPGAVKLEPGEAEQIAAFLGISEIEFFDAHTRLTPDRRHLSLIEKADGSCEYLTSTDDGLACCAIEAVKPVQCRDFPERWNFPDWQKLCGAFSDESI